MFTWITAHVVSAYTDNECIHEDDTNIPKENAPPPLLLPYPEIYCIIAPELVRYAKTPHFIILFSDTVHA